MSLFALVEDYSLLINCMILRLIGSTHVSPLPTQPLPVPAGRGAPAVAVGHGGLLPAAVGLPRQVALPARGDGGGQAEVAGRAGGRRRGHHRRQGLPEAARGGGGEGRINDDPRKKVSHV